MRSRPPSTITERGTSLIEVLVSSGIFISMSMVMFMLVLQNQRASTKATNQNDSTATLMLVFEKVRNEIRHARVIGADPVTKGLRYWLCRTNASGMPVLTPEGLPDWLPGAPAEPSVCHLYKTSSDLLWREYQGGGQPLAPMGKDAQLRFTWRPENRTVSMVGSIGSKDPYDGSRSNFMPFAYEIYLQNNE